MGDYECRGSVLLGTGCLKCDKCIEEIKNLVDEHVKLLQEKDTKIPEKARDTMRECAIQLNKLYTNLETKSSEYTVKIVLSELLSISGKLHLIIDTFN